MDEALVALNSFPDAADSFGSSKKRDTQIRTYLKSVSGLSDAARAAILANPMKALDVCSNASGVCRE
jgi:hypothetical protein